MSDYYCLVAGLPDVSFDDGKLNYTIENFREDIIPSLSSDDRLLINLFFLAQDNKNLIKLLTQGVDTMLEVLGLYSAEELTEFITAVKAGDPRVETYPIYLYDFLEIYFEQEKSSDFQWIDVLNSHYYSYAIGCSNPFLSQWFTFNLNVNNLLVAFMARKYKLDISTCVVGENEVSEALTTSGARDFGLASTLEYFDTILRLYENPNLKERERKIDELRWNWLCENSVFNYFTIEPLFVFLQKIDIIERWTKLDADKGMLCFEELIESLKSGLNG